MKIFTSKKGQLSQLKQQKFKLEKDIQRLFEENLTLLSGYIFIRSEFSIKNSRIDTLAFDPETQAFVIIEYKRQQNSSVVDQGISYLNLMLEYKADFIVEYNEKQKFPLKRNDVDWSQSKVILFHLLLMISKFKPRILKIYLLNYGKLIALIMILLRSILLINQNQHRILKLFLMKREKNSQY